LGCFEPQIAPVPSPGATGQAQIARVNKDKGRKRVFEKLLVQQ